MTVEEFIGTLESSDRLRIIEGKAEVCGTPQALILYAERQEI